MRLTLLLILVPLLANAAPPCLTVAEAKDAIGVTGFGVKLTPPFVRQHAPQRYGTPRVGESQRASVPAAPHHHADPRPVRHEAREHRRFAYLHAHLVLADLQPLEIRVVLPEHAECERQERDLEAGERHHRPRSEGGGARRDAERRGGYRPEDPAPPRDTQ